MCQRQWHSQDEYLKGTGNTYYYCVNKQSNVLLKQPAGLDCALPTLLTLAMPPVKDFVHQQGDEYLLQIMFLSSAIQSL